jgi:pimeloyl-ACP methyl ester carboxylesterase
MHRSAVSEPAFQRKIRRDFGQVSAAMLRKSIQGLSASGFHRISYVEWGNAEATHLVVCVHGLTRNARDFDTLARALEHRCRVICPDLVGRGQSDWLERKQDYAPAQYLADMTALIARATAADDPRTVIDWVGTSVGGLIGMLYAAAARNPIRRLVLNDIGPLIAKAGLERIAMYVGKSPRFASLEDAQAYLRTVSASFGPLTDAQWRHLTEHNVRQEADGAWVMNYDPGIGAAFADVARDNIELWDCWDRIKAPVLVLRGAQSDLLSAETARRMTERGPRARLVEFEGVGHAPALMAEDQVRAVCDFLLAAEPC